MRLLPAIFVLAALSFLRVPAVYGQTAVGSVKGTAVDASGGVLPGVTVIAMASGRPMATTVTDEAGAYLFAALPVGRVEVTFQLEGFATAVEPLAVLQGTESTLVGRLELAHQSETVVVLGVPIPPPPPPRPVAKAVPSHDPDSICGPSKANGLPESFGTIRSRRHEGQHGLYAAGDELIIEGGTLNGLEAGRNLVVRRRYRVNGRGSPELGEHTSGLLQIVEADERVSTAVVVYACDEMMKGDFLAAFKPEPLRAPEPTGAPVFDQAARILFADAGQMMGVARRLMVIDRGSDESIRVGQRLTLFRRQLRDETPVVVGNAVVVAVRGDSATIRVESASDAIVFGDWAAPQRARPSSADPPAADSPLP